MRHNFKTASLMDMRLPSRLKERLWREGLVRNAPLMDVVASLSHEYVETEAQAQTLIDDVIEVNGKITQHAGDFFSYRNGTVPEEIYYGLAAGTLIDMAPEWFPNLPDSYHGLKRQLQIIDDTPEAIGGQRIERTARFCHYISTVMGLENFRTGLRSGSICVDAPGPGNNYTMPEEANKRYKDLVQHVKDHFKPGFPIIGDARRLTIDIDYFFNHYADDFAWYVALASKEKGNVLNADFLYDKIGMPDSAKIRAVFKLTYDFYKAKNKNDPYSAYYEFCEKSLSPFQIFMASSPGTAERSAMTALAYDAVSHPESGKTGLVLPRKTFDVLKVADTISELAYLRMRLRGSAHQPCIMPDEICDLHAKLQASEEISCQKEILMTNFDKERRKAIALYDDITGFYNIEPYSTEGPAPFPQ